MKTNFSAIFSAIRELTRSFKLIIPHSKHAVGDSMEAQRDDPEERHHFRRYLFIVGGTLFVMFFTFIVGFFIAVRGAEHTVVPNIVNMSLPDALIVLQERELYPRLQLKLTGNPNDQGQVIAQKPEPGLYVKAGRRVVITVSQGAIIDKMEDFRGKNIDDVRLHLRSIFSTFEPLIVIGEPVIYVYNDAPEGEILAQTPEPGTGLSEPVELVLIVSRGKSDAKIRIPDWRNLSLESTLNSLSDYPFPFRFIRDSGVEPSGSIFTVTSQNPVANTIVSPGTRVILRYSPPADVPDGFLTGIFAHTLPEYPVPVVLESIVQPPGEDAETYFRMVYVGGEISFPYVLPIGTRIALVVNKSEVATQIVGQ